MTTRNYLLTLCCFLMTMVSVLAQSNLVGVWKTIDDENNQPKSQIQIWEQNGKFYGKVVKFLRADADPNRKCTSCKGALLNKPIMGMTLVNNMSAQGNDYWKGGTILDPEKGKEYTCTMWFEGSKDVLMVRGWIGPFFRTQKWYRVK